MKINKVETADKSRVLEYLKPKESHALFLIGNLIDDHFPGDYYIAEEQKAILGVCGYFPLFHSFSVYSENQEAVRKMTKYAAKRHTITTLLGMSYCALPAYQELLRMGYRSLNDPKQLFMELDLKDFTPSNSTSGKIRKIEEKDIDQVVVLHRYLHNLSASEPISEGEKDKVRLSDRKYGLEIDNKIVCSAISNGIAFKAFQILGVITHPDYRRRGYAKALCSHLIRHFKDNEGAEKAVIFTGYENIAAQTCYSSLGFKSTGEYYLAEVFSSVKQ